MADEDELLETPAVPEAPSGDDQAEVETPELDADGNEPEAEGEGGQEDDGEDFESEDGEKFRIPKKLAPYLMRNKDYTQKTQTVADRAKALDARDAEIEERLKTTDEELDARAELKRIDKRIAEYAKLTPEDWAHHRSQDPMATDNARDEYAYLKDQKAALDGKLAKATTERTQKSAADLAKRVEDTLAAAPKLISNWNPADKDKIIGGLMEFAVSKNIPEQTLKANWSPQFLELLHLAKLGDQLVKKQSVPKPKTIVPPPEPITIIKPSGGNAPPTGLSDKLSPEEWTRRRNAQVAKRAQG